MEYQEELNEFQKKRINARLKMDFKQELKKSSELSERKKFSKNFRNSLDILINEMYQDGVMFYGFTILKPYLKIEDPNLWYYIHLQVEYLINSFKDIELIEFCYLSIELHSGLKKKIKPGISKSLALLKQHNLEGLPHFHGILAVRSLLGRNSHHYNEIKKIFNDDLDDIMIKPLLNVKAIKGYWNYVIEENNFKFHRFVQYSKIYENLYASISDLELQYDPVEHYAFGLDENLNNKYCDITGVRDLNPLDQTKINYLISLYMQR